MSRQCSSQIQSLIHERSAQNCLFCRPIGEDGLSELTASPAPVQVLQTKALLPVEAQHLRRQRQLVVDPLASGAKWPDPRRTVHPVSKVRDKLP